MTYPNLGKHASDHVRSSVVRRFLANPSASAVVYGRPERPQGERIFWGLQLRKPMSSAVSGVSRCISAPLANVFGSRRKRSGVTQELSAKHDCARESDEIVSREQRAPLLAK